jgi:hypothetical protein
MTAPNHLSLEQKLAFIQMAAAADSPFRETLNKAKFLDFYFC